MAKLYRSPFWEDGVRRVFLAGVCLWVAGCGFNRNRATPAETAEVALPDTAPALREPAVSPNDPPVENPIRDLTEDIEAPPPIADGREPDPVSSDPAGELFESLLSAWVDYRVIDLIFPGSRFQQGPEFLDGGPNTLCWICVDGGTPEFLCRQRYGP